MTSLQQPSRAMNIALWITQVLLAAGMAFGSFTKLFTPIDELAKMWPWAGEVSPLVVKGTGVVDLLGLLGIILPGLLRIKPQLVSLAAVGIVLLMICAIVFHFNRGEGSQTGINFVFAAMAAFIAWGRRERSGSSLPI